MAPISGKPALTGWVWAEHFPTSAREERTILIASNHRKLSRQLDNRELGFLEKNSALKEKFEFLCFWNRSSPTEFWDEPGARAWIRRSPHPAAGPRPAVPRMADQLSFRGQNCPDLSFLYLLWLISFTHFIFQILLVPHIIDAWSFLLFDGNNFNFKSFYFSYNTVMIKGFKMSM